MARETLWEDEYTLLCERCGYVVEGLDPTGNCPECGKAIAESLPERRVGTPWQLNADPASLCMTWAHVVLKPLQTLDRLRFDRLGIMQSGRSMILAASLTTGGVVAVIAAQCMAVDWDRQPPSRDKSDFSSAMPAFFLVGGVLFGVISAISVIALTLVESIGLKYFGSRRGYRVDLRMSARICAHGSIGWILGVFGYALVWFFFNGWRQSSGLAFDAGMPWSQPWELDALWILLIPLAGFLFFELFAWLGLRRCKFANRVRPASLPRSDGGAVGEAD